MKHFLLILFLFAQALQAQWIQTNGLQGDTITSLVASGPNIFAANNSGDMFRSTNNGTSWSSDSALFPVDLFVQDGKNIFAATTDTITTIYQSTNNGSQWIKIVSFSKPSSFGGTLYNVTSLAVSDSIIIVPVLHHPGPSSYGTIIHVSVDNGKNWKDAELPVVSAVAICGDYIFAGATTPIMQTNKPDLYTGVLRSSDNGVTWTDFSSGLRSAPNFLAVSGKNIFAADNGVFLSTDYGSHWSAANSGIPTGLDIYILAVNGTNVFAGSADKVFLSTNNGASWSDVSAGLKNLADPFHMGHRRIFSLAVSEMNIFAGTDSGVWRRPLSEMITSVKDYRIILPETFVLQQNYPNPFNPSTTIRYALPFSAYVKLMIYNMLGQVVSELVDEEQSAGWKEVRWDESGTSSGVYFYQLIAAGRIKTGRMNLVK